MDGESRTLNVTCTYGNCLGLLVETPIVFVYKCSNCGRFFRMIETDAQGKVFKRSIHDVKLRGVSKRSGINVFELAHRGTLRQVLEGLDLATLKKIASENAWRDLPRSADADRYVSRIIQGTLSRTRHGDVFRDYP